MLSAEGNGRTRVVLNMNSMAPYTTRVEGDSVYIEVGATAAAQPTFAAQPVSTAAAPAAAGGRAAQVVLADAATPVANPAFDVTPARLVTGIVTERGVARPVFGG